MTIRYEIAQDTRIGHRRINQDRAVSYESGDRLLLCLADGMGGHPRGEVAAQILMDVAKERFKATRKPIANPEFYLQQLLEMAHERILRFGRQQTPAIEPRATAVLCLIQDDIATWAHIGDSRLYLVRRGIVSSQTEDHSYVEELHRQGILSKDQTANHLMKNYVTRCIGGSTNIPLADYEGPIELMPDDVILLCSDGLWSGLDSNQWLNIISNQEIPLQQSAEYLARNAVSRNQPASDNVTLLAIRILEVSINLHPADISMSLADNAHANESIDHDGVSVDEAIERLRDLIDQNITEE